jgi:hypothetical protein
MNIMRINDLYWEVRNLPYNIKRTWKLVKVYWPTCDGDWSSIAIVLLHQIRQVREHIDEHQVIADADQVVHQMRIAEQCLERMLAGDHADLADKRFPERNRNWADMINELEKQDVEILTRELRRHLRNWWD